MLLNLTEHSDEPLQGQIARQVRAKILAGDLAEGDLLPSIRALASEQHVSVITVQRAYERLEHDGLLQSRNRRGFFVAALSETAKRKRAEQHLKERIEPILKNAQAEGLTPVDIEQIIGRLLTRLSVEDVQK